MERALTPSKKIEIWYEDRGGHPWDEYREMPVSFGRPSTYTDAKGARLVAALKEGLAIPQAVKAVGVSVQTLYNWRRSHPEFNFAVERALKGEAVNKRVMAMRKRVRRDDFDNLIANIILDELARGRTMKDICKAIDMPSRATVYKWAKSRPDFKERINQCSKRATTSRRRSSMQ